ncbi:PHP domain-containing protein [Lysobacter korlensis]|uniref:PHP domain-containing protein n=1 Tax=Lysobacter korlensis TaxID=553636 RepID=A0ABV6RZ37_9GAMM
MPGHIDLHTHSSVSDGTQTPTQLIRAAAAVGIGTVALTDHDSTAGWQEAAAAVRGTGMTLVPGIELSAQLDYASVHVLGYLFDPGDADLISETARIRAERLSRAEAMVQRIAADYALAWEDVLAQTVPGATVGRPHIADALVAKGHVPTRSAAFESILHWKGGYYRPHYAPEPVDAVRLIAAAGGVPVIAHAGARGPAGLLNDRRMRVLVDAGLFGLEVYHRDNPPAARKRLLEMAMRFGLAVTGSSDYHGVGKVNALAENTTEPEVLEALLARGTGSDPVHG